MAIIKKKISDFSILSDLTGDEYLAVAYNGKTYKIPTSYLLGTIISKIDEQLNEGDRAENIITLTTSVGQEFTFTVRNGAKGPTGDIGEKGAKGDTGDHGLLLSVPVEDLIVNTLDSDLSNRLVVQDLEQKAISAAQASILGNMLSNLHEEYLTQDEYDQLLADGEIYDDVKYFIYDDDDLA